MHCSDSRTALSARVDGEALPPGVAGAALDAHVRGCIDCRRWEHQVVALRKWITSIDSGSH
ncbi:zf-HC2 domain-containing protein [Streptomyces sp. HSW2009]|uniref:zf-HC2 domain-containing protein n=1 Tax=Streptomyces sp. HSW2009 TaxID=3142890 RepID=UPI0032EF2180